MKIHKTNPFSHRAPFDSAQGEVNGAQSAKKWLTTRNRCGFDSCERQDHRDPALSIRYYGHGTGAGPALNM